MNEQNLKPFTKQNAKTLGQKGGKMSALKRLEQKTIKEQLSILLSLEVADETEKQKLKSKGFCEKELSNQTLLIYSLFERAINGDPKAYEIIFKTIVHEDSEKKSRKWDDLEDMFP